MTRRTAVAVVAGAAIAVTANEPEWITIAHPGWNLNRRAYTEEALDSMRRQLPGKLIGRTAEMELERHEILGGVRESRRNHDGDVQVLVSWFTDIPVPVGQYLTPTAMSSGHTDKGDGFMWIDERGYNLRFLHVDKSSAFERATPVGRL